MKNNKQRLLEIMSSVDKSFKPKLNEYDNYNYPAGADADPRAPWNQKDDEFSGLDIDDIDFNPKYPTSFTITSKSTGGGVKTYDGFELLEKTQDPELHHYFDKFDGNALSYKIVNSPEFQKMAEKLFFATTDYNEDWEYDNLDEDINQNDPNYQIGVLTSRLESKHAQVERLYKYLNETPEINVIKGFVKGVLDRW